MSLTAWISEKLGHDPSFLSSSSNYYSTIDIETASILTEHQAAAVNEAQRTAVANRDAINELKEAIKNIEITPAIPNIKKLSKEEKFKVIDKSIANGFKTYSELQSKGITTYMFSKYKKARNKK